MNPSNRRARARAKAKALNKQRRTAKPLLIPRGVPKMPEINIQAPQRETFYRMEIYSDTQVGDIICRIPVDFEGELDTSRPILFTGKTTVNGQVVIEFPFPDAKSLPEAIAQWPAVCKSAIEQMLEQQRAAATRKALLTK